MKTGSAAPIVLGGIVLVIISFFALEFFRGKELKDSLPEYAVAESYDEAYIKAKEIAFQSNGKVYNTDGGSNAWLFPFEKSIIVLTDKPYAELEQHDFVGYVNSRGEKIFHRLIKQKDGGWVAMGDNNASSDKELVTKSNYIGILAEPVYSWKSALKKDESLLSVFD